MLRTVEATIDKNGGVHLSEPVRLSHTCHAIVTILEGHDVCETAVLSELALGEDWNRPEEDKAWSHLQQGR